MMNKQLKHTIFFLQESFYCVLSKTLFNVTIEYCKHNNVYDFNENQDFLRLAVKFNSIDTVKFLLSNGANAKTDNSQLLCQAVADGKYKVAKLLLKYGAEVNVDKNDPLLLAFNTRNYRMAKFLIKKGAISDERMMEAANRLKDSRLFNLAVSKDKAALKDSH